MSLALILAQGIGQLLASIARAKGHGGAANVIASTEALATSTLSAVEAHLAAHPEDGVTVEQFQAKVEAAKASALAAGDEAQARIDAREGDEG